jgi:hypothetical protein
MFTMFLHSDSCLFFVRLIQLAAVMSSCAHVAVAVEAAAAAATVVVLHIV